uniref:Uncharacterized protein n=1 Tax=Schmidtea mediterranea TaxID=79327 RepID=I1ZIG0_SCHMD|nr:hypothetical protein [Schmidtea mediterranea]
MFIFKLGAEALTRLEEHLNDQTTQPSTCTQKTITSNNLYTYSSNMESSILYNLLSTEDGSMYQPMPPRANTISFSDLREDPISLSPRPYSAPQSDSSSNIRKRKHSIISEITELKTMNYIKNCRINGSRISDIVDSPTISCSTDSFSEEPMDLSKTGDQIQSHGENGRLIVNSWLIDIVEIINPNNEQSNKNLAELSLSVRLHLLQSTWHRIIVTFLFEHLMKTSSIHLEGITKFISSLSGINNRSVFNNKKISKMYKTQLEELNNILYQIKKLNLDEMSMHYLRIGLLLTGNHDEMNKKNLNLIEMFIHSKIGISELNILIIRETIENVLKLNSVIIETIFYSHLDESVENVIEQILNNS